MNPFVSLVLRTLTTIIWGCFLVGLAATMLGTVLPPNAPLFAHVFIGVTSSAVMLIGARKILHAVTDLLEDALHLHRERRTRDIEVPPPPTTPQA